jgi:lipoprotein-anchoring transpeptidase ErfK/SrfK
VTRLRYRILVGAALMAAPTAFSLSLAAGATANAATGSSPAGRVPQARPKPVAVRALGHLGGLSHYAFVEQPVLARAEPTNTARKVSVLHTSTFWNTSTVVEALEQTTWPAGHTWTRVRFADPPRELTGWVPTSSLSPLRAVHTWLRVDRETLTATLVRDGRIVFTAPVGVGQPQWPTPAGQFFIEESLTPPEANGVYGAFAFGTSAHSDVLTEWPNEGQIGVHGTNEPWLIPGRISHGCVRLHNEDILRLERLMPVGTPITIS